MKATSIATFTVTVPFGKLPNGSFTSSKSICQTGKLFRSTPQKIIWKTKLKTILITWDFQGSGSSPLPFGWLFFGGFPGQDPEDRPHAVDLLLGGVQLLKRKVVALLPTYSRWWQLKYFWLSSLTWGNDAIWRSYFSDGLNHQLLIWFPF